jgi:uncharacterized membrane protein YphA (DoxX/SURF4 family)
MKKILLLLTILPLAILSYSQQNCSDEFVLLQEKPKNISYYEARDVITGKIESATNSEEQVHTCEEKQVFPYPIDNYATFNKVHFINKETGRWDSKFVLLDETGMTANIGLLIWFVLTFIAGIGLYSEDNNKLKLSRSNKKKVFKNTVIYSGFTAAVCLIVIHAAGYFMFNITWKNYIWTNILGRYSFLFIACLLSIATCNITAFAKEKIKQKKMTLAV